MSPTIEVSSEVGLLKKVIVHRPDEGIARISPRRAEELLFDDIVYLPRMQEEHDIFVRILKAFLGYENVLETQDLLYQALEADPAGKADAISLIVDYEELPRSVHEMLGSISNRDLAEILITGYYPKEDHILFDPIPNFIFTRDIAVTINDHVLITKANKEARFRENYLTRFIFSSHPLFTDLWSTGRVINLNDVNRFPPSKRGEQVSIEGGDVMVLSQDFLLIGVSERSTSYGAQVLRDVLFELGVIANVAQITVPSERSFMHIDTIFTQIHQHHIVSYNPIVVEGVSSRVDVFRSNGATTNYPNIKDFILEEVNPNMQFIPAGNGLSPYQEREQWTDGCNLVALKPGVALTYDRNPRTEDALRAFGYTIRHANELLPLLESGKLQPEAIENTIISLPSSELSRARGGSHCMTCPIHRA